MIITCAKYLTYSKHVARYARIVFNETFSMILNLFRYGVPRGINGGPGTSDDGSRRRPGSHYHLLLNVARRYYSLERKTPWKKPEDNNPF